MSFTVDFSYRREGEKRLNDHIAELKKQLAARDQMIQRLQKDLKGKEQVYQSIWLQGLEIALMP